MVHLSCYTNSCIVRRLFPEGAGQKMPHCQDERRTSTGTGIGAEGFFHQLVPSLGLQGTTAAVSTAASLCNRHANVHIHPDRRHLASLMQVSDTPTLPETAPDLLPSPASEHNPTIYRNTAVRLRELTLPRLKFRLQEHSSAASQGVLTNSDKNLPCNPTELYAHPCLMLLWIPPAESSKA